MDINLLAVSVGNSRLALGTFVGGELKNVSRLSHAQRGDWPAMIEQAWRELDGADNAAVAAAGVNPPLAEPLEHAIAKVTGTNVEWVGRDVEPPIKLIVKHPEQTGIDRVLNIAAAHEQM